MEAEIYQKKSPEGLENFGALASPEGEAVREAD